MMNRYTPETNITLAAGQGSEWDRNTDLAYTIQSGPLRICPALA